MVDGNKTKEVRGWILGGTGLDWVLKNQQGPSAWVKEWVRGTQEKGDKKEWTERQEGAW